MEKVHLFPMFPSEQKSQLIEVSENIQLIQAPGIWEQSNYGQGTVIAVLDTGCQIDHPDLKHNIVGGRNFTSDDGGNPDIFLDSHYHGTHVAEIIAASLNGKGIAGVAPKASLLILKVLNKRGNGDYNSLISAIEYAIKWRGENREKVRIIMMSLGGEKDDPRLHEAIKRAVLRDILVICAAGNNGDGDVTTREKMYPGFYPEVVSVGAVDNNKKLAPFSNTNEEIDFLALGTDILSTYPYSSYRTLSGISMAAPHVAGAAALIIQVLEKKLNRDVTEKEVYEFLSKQATPL